MDKIQIKCGHCGKTMLIDKQILLPYSGKSIQINCLNPDCKQPQKLAVPEFKMSNPTDNKTAIESNKTIMETKAVNADNGSVNKVATLNILKNAKTEAQTFQLDIGTYVVGRYVNKPGVFVPDIAIKTNDSFISKKHCQITVLSNRQGGKDYILRDAGSANGTFFNSTIKPLDANDEVYLNNADTIILGDTHIVFELK